MSFFPIICMRFGRLPEGDVNFSTRWRLIKEAFTRAYHQNRCGP